MGQGQCARVHPGRGAHRRRASAEGVKGLLSSPLTQHLTVMLSGLVRVGSDADGEWGETPCDADCRWSSDPGGVISTKGNSAVVLMDGR
jgi:hypothetical protein